MKRILLGIGMIVFVSAIAAGATGAFFSDTETSTGNTFTAGAIDLKVDSTQHYNNAVCTNGVWVLAAGQTIAVDQYPVLGSACTGSWTLTDLGPTNQFFNFGDVKPGDRGENTVSLHIDNNNAWACLDLRTTGNNENTLVEPESDAGDVTLDPSGGELAQNIKVFSWLDNASTSGAIPGDNIWQAGEPMLFSPVALSGLGSTTTLPLADSVTNGGATMAPGVTSYIGLFWCAGNLTAVAGVITCDGSAMGNQSQTDSATTTVSFRVVQSRNNPTFQCSNQVVVEEPITVTVTANDLDAGPAASAATNGLGKWFMYNDTTDVIDNNLGTFVAGPAGVPNGANSIQFVLGASPLDRKNIATFKFQGTVLSTITQMGFGVYSHGGTGGAGPNESPFLAFNVDFFNTGVFQNRLVYVPTINTGAVPQDTWNSYDVIAGGAAKWVYSGANWPAPNAQPGTTPKTWAQILADYPSAKILGLGGWLGIRVGEPGPTNYIGNVDFFKIATGGPVTTYDFGN